MSNRDMKDYLDAISDRNLPTTEKEKLKALEELKKYARDFAEKAHSIGSGIYAELEGAYQEQLIAESTRDSLINKMKVWSGRTDWPAAKNGTGELPAQ